MEGEKKRLEGFGEGLEGEKRLAAFAEAFEWEKRLDGLERGLQGEKCLADFGEGLEGENRLAAFDAAFAGENKSKAFAAAFPGDSNSACPPCLPVDFIGLKNGLVRFCGVPASFVDSSASRFPGDRSASNKRILNRVTGIDVDQLALDASSESLENWRSDMSS